MLRRTRLRPACRKQGSTLPGSRSRPPRQQYVGQLLAANGDSAGARRAFEAAKAAKPDLVMAELSLAAIDTAEGRREDARKRLSVMVAAHPDSIPGHLLFGELELTEGKSAAALEQYRKALALDEKNSLAVNNVAYLLAESNQPDEALKYAQKAKELAPANAAVDDTLGWTYYQKGLYSMAVTHLQSAVAREGTAIRKYHLAMAYTKAGDSKRGRETLDAALKMNPNLPEAQAARQLLGSR
jgi:tetratricopeptide (TPR) repeat protein